MEGVVLGANKIMHIPSLALFDCCPAPWTARADRLAILASRCTRCCRWAQRATGIAKVDARCVKPPGMGLTPRQLLARWSCRWLPA
jgi:hypothetical protein